MVVGARGVYTSCPRWRFAMPGVNGQTKLALPPSRAQATPVLGVSRTWTGLARHPARIYFGILAATSCSSHNAGILGVSRLSSPWAAPPAPRAARGCIALPHALLAICLFTASRASHPAGPSRLPGVIMHRRDARLTIAHAAGQAAVKRPDVDGPGGARHLRIRGHELRSTRPAHGHRHSDDVATALAWRACFGRLLVALGSPCIDLPPPPGALAHRDHIVTPNPLSITMCVRIGARPRSGRAILAGVVSTAVRLAARRRRCIHVLVTIRSSRTRHQRAIRAGGEALDHRLSSVRGGRREHAMGEGAARPGAGGSGRRVRARRGDRG